MKNLSNKIFAFVFASALLLCALTYAFAAPAPRRVRFEQLSEFVNETQRNKTGTRFVVTSVPVEKIRHVAPRFKGANRGGLFYLSSGEDDGDVSTSFVTTGALVRELRGRAAAEAATLRVSAVLVEFVGEFDVYRSPFVTKIEGLREDGSTAWTAAGAEPLKVRIPQ